jgi:hypothetical protein
MKKVLQRPPVHPTRDLTAFARSPCGARLLTTGKGVLDPQVARSSRMNGRIEPAAMADDVRTLADFPGARASRPGKANRTGAAAVEKAVAAEKAGVKAESDLD